MKYLILLFVFSTLAANAQTQKRLLINHANVIDVTTGKVTIDASLLIVGERIAAIGKTIKSQKEDLVIDAAGKYMIPGLWDMHTHVLADYKTNFSLLIANGITGIRNMHSTVENPLQALANIRKLLKEDSLVGPRLVANGQIVDGEPAFWPSSYKVHNATEARFAVDSLIKAGAEFIKVYNDLSREAYFAIAEESIKLHIPFAGHVPYSVSLAEVARSGQKSIEHNYGLLEASTKIEMELKQERKAAKGDSLGFITYEHLLAEQDSQKRKETVELLAKQKVWICPTLSVIGLIDSSAVFDTITKKYLSARMYTSTEEDYKHYTLDPKFAAQFEKVLALHLALVRDLKKGGVQLLAGTDVGNPGVVPGFGLHKELALLVEAGLTPIQALQTATINPAIFLTKEKELGTIEKGKLADLIILDANPLINIRNTTKIHAVLVNGKYLDRKILNSLLAYAEVNKK